jgi:hypothetical protein
MTIGPTRTSDKQAESDEIERKTRDFLANGGQIQREEIRTTKQVDLTWRNYADTAMEDANSEKNSD